MISKNLFLAAALAITLTAAAAELKTEGNAVKFGKSQLNIMPDGFLTVTDTELFSSMMLHFTTNHPDKWIPINAPSVTRSITSADNGSWNINAQVPASSSDKIDARMNISATPFNSVEMDIDWKTPDMTNILEVGLFISFPVRFVDGKSITVNGNPQKVVNETKYGWFSQTVENPVFAVYQDEAGREHKLSFTGKYNVIIGTVKDGSVTIRVNALPGAKEMKLSFIPK